MRVGAAHRITIDAFGWDPFAAAAFDGIVDAQHDRTGGYKALDQQLQQKATRCTPAPASTIQHAMIVDETALPAQSYDAQATRDGPLARSQQRTDEKHLGMPPDTTGKQRGKGVQKSDKQRRQRQQAGPLPRSSSHYRSFTKWPKSSLVNRFVPTGPIVLGMDDTIERRRGKRIQAKGISREAAL